MTHETKITAPLRAVAVGAGSSGAGGAFAINFLRREVPSVGLRRAGIVATLSVMAANGLVLLILMGMAASLHEQEQSARAGVSASGSRANSVDAVVAELQPLQKRAADNLATLRRMIAAQQGRFPVAQKLAALTATVPARTWITSVAGDRDAHRLSIDAVYVIDPAAPTELPINGWMSALKADARFREGLQKLEMASSERDAQGRAQLMRFTLAASWTAPE